MKPKRQKRNILCLLFLTGAAITNINESKVDRSMQPALNRKGEAGLSHHMSRVVAMPDLRAGAERRKVAPPQTSIVSGQPSFEVLF